MIIFRLWVNVLSANIPMVIRHIPSKWWSVWIARTLPSITYLHTIFTRLLILNQSPRQIFWHFKLCTDLPPVTNASKTLRVNSLTLVKVIAALNWAKVSRKGISARVLGLDSAKILQICKNYEAQIFKFSKPQICKIYSVGTIVIKWTQVGGGMSVQLIQKT